ncbi:MAG: carboxymuconolactone decarboxylase family protein [Actinomycetota bacterium]
MADAYHDPELAAAGKAVQEQLWGPMTGGGGGFPAARLAPEFFALVQQFAFGMFWARPGLATRDRSLVTVSQLAALGRTDELKAHLRGALNVGLSREELVEMLMQTAVYAGVPAAVNALNAAAEVLAPPE